MKQYDTIFLDRDGTLNPDPGYINNLSQFNFFDFTMEGIQNIIMDFTQFVHFNHAPANTGLVGNNAKSISVFTQYFEPFHGEIKKFKLA